MSSESTRPDGAPTRSPPDPEGTATTTPDGIPVDDAVGDGMAVPSIGRGGSMIQEGPSRPDEEARLPAGSQPGTGGLDTIEGPTGGGAAAPAPAATDASLSSSFAQLAFRTFETYMNEARGGADQFPPLQVLQHMNLCGSYGSDGLARLTGPPPSHLDSHHRGRPLEPIAIRHIHSTPLQHTPSIMDDEDEYEPPPVGLEILNRSRSTPLSTSKNSAFGTILRTASHSVYDDRQGANSASAFTLMPGPYPMLKSSSRSAERGTKPVIFNPIKHDVEMGGEGELTSIEIVDLPRHLKQESTPPVPKGSKSNAASRAAKFLTDVRNLRLRHNPDNRGGRENPARPPSESDESSSRRKASACADEETISSKSSGNSSEKGPMPAASRANALDSSMPPDNADTKQPFSGADDSVKDQQPKQGRKPEPKDSATRDTIESPATVPFNFYQRLEDSPNSSNANTSGERNAVCIQVNQITNAAGGSGSDSPAYAASSPEPGRAGATTPHSQDSPERFSSTTSSSGQTTHATSASHSSGHATNLSSISETDREVMEVNTNRKCGTSSSASVDREVEATASDKADRIELSLSSGRNVRFGDYVELVDTPSPENARDGACVQADRFFTRRSESTEKRGALHRLRGLGSKSKAGTSHSPNTVSSASANTSDSASSIGDEPPKIVSYLDRKQVSDLTSAVPRGEIVERSSPRAGLEDREVRDSSPSEQVLADDSEVVFEGAQAPKAGVSTNPRPVWPAKGLQLGRKIRSLPPRSPYRGLRSSTTTPPPGGSPPYGISPPRPMVDHKGEVDPNLISRSFVLAPTSSRPGTSPGIPEVLASSGNVNYTHIPGAGSDQGSHEVVRLSPSAYDMSSVARLPRGSSPIGGMRTHSISPVGGRRPRTYQESSIEILKTDSKEDSSSCPSPIPLVTPEKGGS